MHTTNVLLILSAHLESPLTAGRVGQYVVQHHDVTALKMRPAGAESLLSSCSANGANLVILECRCFCPRSACLG